MPDEPETIEVKVPAADFRMGPVETAVWDTMGIFIDTAKGAIGRDMAFSIILSRISRELRREVGMEETAKLFRRLADTQTEAAKGDL